MGLILFTITKYNIYIMKCITEHVGYLLDFAILASEHLFQDILLILK